MNTSKKCPGEQLQWMDKIKNKWKFNKIIETVSLPQDNIFGIIENSYWETLICLPTKNREHSWKIISDT